MICITSGSKAWSSATRHVPSLPLCSTWKQTPRVNLYLSTLPTSACSPFYQKKLLTHCVLQLLP